MLHPFLEDFDPYGKDISLATTGTDCIFRMKVDKEGYITGRVCSLSKEEAEEYRSENGHSSSKAPKRKQKAKA